MKVLNNSYLKNENINLNRQEEKKDEFGIKE